MGRLFAIGGSGSYAPIVLRDATQWDFLVGKKNFQRLAQDWESLAYEVDEISRYGKPLPDISTSYVSGTIIFRASSRSAIFSAPCSELEFLPITVEGEPWYLLNCLKTTKHYDPALSKLAIEASGQIAFVHRLVVHDSTLEACELFTLENSNRAQLFCLRSFKERIEGLGLNGLSFREIGHCEI